jgi:hypothetical protein
LAALQGFFTRNAAYAIEMATRPQARSYWDNKPPYFGPKKFSIPAAFTVFPGEIYQPSRRWAEGGYSNLAYFNEVDKGGHFAAWEQPQLFAEEVDFATLIWPPLLPKFGPPATLTSPFRSQRDRGGWVGQESPSGVVCRDSAGVSIRRRDH